MTARALLGSLLLLGSAAFVEAGPPVVGTQPIAWILIHYADRLNPVTHAMATAAAEKVTTFYAAASYGTLQLAIDVYGPVTVAQPSGYCLGFAVPQAEALLAASLGGYERRVFVVPPSPCPWSGTTTMGLIPTRAFLNGTVASWTTTHETGHLLGMFHAHGLLCPNHASLCAPGTRVEYGDRWDVMGSGTAARHPSAAQKIQLGWFDPIDATPGVYTLTGFEQTPSALRIRRTGFDEDLLVEYRAAPLKKVLVHLQRSTPGPYLVLAFPASYRLIPGKVWTDPQTGQTLLVEALTDTTARVRVGP